jgi:hypothetical protein
MELFDQFAAEEEPEGRAFGLGGRASVLTLLGRYRDATEALEELWPLRNKLLSRPLRQMLEGIIEKNQGVLTASALARWRQWREEQAAEK